MKKIIFAIILTFAISAVGCQCDSDKKGTPEASTPEVSVPEVSVPEVSVPEIDGWGDL